MMGFAKSVVVDGRSGSINALQDIRRRSLDLCVREAVEPFALHIGQERPGVAVVEPAKQLLVAGPGSAHTRYYGPAHQRVHRDWTVRARRDVVGELLLLEYRGERSVVLPYSPRRFTVPRNVIVLGTMHTADRSLALVDFALRRRFNAFPLNPSPDVLAGRATEHLDADTGLLLSLFQLISDQGGNRQPGRSGTLLLDDRRRRRRRRG